jgi:hypothetical protein
LKAQENPQQIPGKIVLKLSDSQFNIQDVKNFLSSKYEIAYIKKAFPLAEKPVKSSIHGHQTIDLSRYVEIQLTSDMEKDACIQELNKAEIVAYAEPRYIPELLYVPDDPSHESQYYLSTIQAYEAWDIHKSDTNMVIAIVDTGVDMDHEDLIYNIAYNYDDPIDGIDNDNDGFVDNFRGWDMGDNDNFPQNEMNEHGTLCAGMSAAHTDNGLGVAGVGFKSRMLPIKVQDVDSLLTRAYEGIVYAADQGAQVINCSWGNTHYAQFEQDIVQYAAINKDALVVAAAGNDNNIVNFYPASYDYVLSVAGTTGADEKWTPENGNSTSGSSFGYHVDICAPGIRIMTTSDGNDYRQAYAGTSFSAPIVAGAAGVLRSKYPQLSALQSIEHLKNTADNIDTIAYNEPWQEMLGAGRLNMFRAVSEPFNPGLVFQNIQIFDDSENQFENSNIVEIQGVLFNYLHDAENVEIAVSVHSNNASVLTPSLSLGSIDSLSSLTINNPGIQIELDEPINYDEKVIVKLEITADNFSRIQYVEFLVNPSYANISNGSMLLSIPANGKLGFADNYRQIGNGFNYNEFRDLFYDAAWIMGNATDALIDAVRVDTEFQMIQASSNLEDDFADEVVFSQLLAYDVESSLNLEINQKVSAWYDLPNAFMIELDVVNQNIVDVNDFYATLFTDWDLFKYNRNRISWDETKQIAYAEHTGDVKLYAGYMLLSNQSINHYAMDQLNYSEGLVDMTNGLSVEEKFYCMSNTNHAAGQVGYGTDVAQMFGAGPMDLAAQDTVKMAFGMLVAQSFYELQVAADSLRAYYDNMYPDESGITISDNYGFTFYPNPANNEVFLNFSDAVSGECEIRIYDVNSRLVYEKTVPTTKRSINLNLQTGVYQLTVKVDSTLYQNKLLIHHN